MSLLKYFAAFSLLICISSINLDLGYKNIVNNPYRIFGLPPWSSMKKIKTKYRQLVLKYHPDKSHGKTTEQFQLIQQSYENIKKSRKEHEESDEQMSFSTVISDTVKGVILVELIFFVAYVISYLIYKLQLLVIIPLFYQVIAFVVIDNIIPHWFDEQGVEYFICLCSGIGLYVVHLIIKKIFKSVK